MNIWNNKWFKLSIHKKGKGEPFHWKCIVVPHRKSMGTFKYIGTKDCPELFHVQYYFVTFLFQIFFLWFIIALEMKEEKLSETKMVPYKSTHFAAIDELKKW